jgi:hypothetical protein
MPPFRSRRGRRSGALVALVVAASLAGCGNAGEAAESAPGPSAPSPTSAPTSPSPTMTSPFSSASPDIRVIEVQITDGEVHTAADRVDISSGEAIRVVVTSDVDDELHVHGVDQTAALVAGEPTSVEFSIDEPGVYEVETHDGGLVLLQLSVR